MKTRKEKSSITLFFQHNDKKKVTAMKLKKTTRFIRVRESLIKHELSLSPNHFLLVYNGETVKEDDTPNSIGIANEETIEVILPMTGG